MSSSRAAKQVFKSLPSLPGLPTTTCTKARCASSVRSLSARSRHRPQIVLTCFRKTHQTRLYYDYAIHRQQTATPLPSIPPSSYYHNQLPFFDFFAATKPKPSYLFASGATGFAKRGRPQHNHYDPTAPSDSYYQSVQVGEDAYFVRSDALGVADGVGGWAGTLGANPALYSRKLMHHAHSELERFDNVDDDCFAHYDEAHPVDILQRSYDLSLREARREGVIGSSTACVALLRNDELRVANLGDCGISVIRQNSYIFRNEEQQHAFNFPYQLGTNSPDKPKDAQTFDIKVEKGDIVILGTDGLFDNLFDKEILAIVKAHVNAYTIPGSGQRPPRLLNFNPQKLSDALAARARVVSEDRRNLDSPFQTQAINEGYFHQGGKSDDISVVVAVINDSEDSPDRRL
ncbi:phosphatase 2C-like domain-containing protein [Zychaea mexicana]|uniref:phosphatase 2C-like domain-containing protein n=1 Tax=Zychaea mexicana TaxID=64656 RepID=UPI0022FF28A0|nr:phosphatase 2C-like domain-containing protein [Zychaea mexicana]KAI9497538.1 phosphatase 2C-like domain-containing protein [Zychaea mexicana]